MIYLFRYENQITNNTIVGNHSTGLYDPTDSLGRGDIRHCRQKRGGFEQLQQHFLGQHGSSAGRERGGCVH